MSEETTNTPEDVKAGELYNQSKSHAKQAAGELRAAAAATAQQLREAATTGASKIREVADQKGHVWKETATTQAATAKEYAGNQWESARTHAKDWQASGEDFIRENPTKAVLSALGVGFVLGLIFRR